MRGALTGLPRLRRRRDGRVIALGWTVGMGRDQLVRGLRRAPAAMRNQRGQRDVKERSEMSEDGGCVVGIGRVRTAELSAACRPSGEPLPRTTTTAPASAGSGRPSGLARGCCCRCGCGCGCAGGAAVARLVSGYDQSLCWPGRSEGGRIQPAPPPPLLLTAARGARTAAPPTVIGGGSPARAAASISSFSQRCHRADACRSPPPSPRALGVPSPVPPMPSLTRCSVSQLLPSSTGCSVGSASSALAPPPSPCTCAADAAAIA